MCLLSVNICQPLKETHLKSEKVNFQHYSSTPGAQICRGNELRYGHLNFHRRDSEYLLWFMLEPQKHQLPPLSALLTVHATSHYPSDKNASPISSTILCWTELHLTLAVIILRPLQLCSLSTTMTNKAS